MIGSLGLGESLISFRAVSDGVFDPGLVGRVLGSSDGREAVDEVLKAQKKKARALLMKNKRLVLALRDALLDRDELIGDEIIAVLEEAGGAAAQTAHRAPARASRAASRAASRGRRAAAATTRS
jgi:hypothetical protein